MHISKKKQKRRFKKYLSDPNLAWRVTREYRRQHRDYEEWVSAVEEMLARTETSYAPWHMIEANEQRWAAVRIFEVLAQTIEQGEDKRGREERPGQANGHIESVQKIAELTQRKQ